MLQRVVSGVIMAVATVAILLLPTIWRVLGVAVIMLIADSEMIGAVRSAGFRPLAWPSIAFALLMLPCVYFDQTELFWAALVFVVLALFAARVFAGAPTMKDGFASLVPVLYPLGFFYFLLGGVMLPDKERLSLMILGIGAPCLSDTFALFGGIALGRHKLAPEISPKKTWEGAAFGFLGGIAAGVIVWALQGIWLADYPLWLFVAGGALASIAGQIGDLAASAIKREAGIKDFGSIIPGHGGIIDRLDSILFAMPFVSLLFYAAGA